MIRPLAVFKMIHEQNTKTGRLLVFEDDIPLKVAVKYIQKNQLGPKARAIIEDKVSDILQQFGH